VAGILKTPPLLDKLRVDSSQRRQGGLWIVHRFLVDVLKYGVAFHYGNMPGSIRAGVEELFKARKLKFICCTSTLLQGVNLPVRDLVIEAPRKGIDHPMGRADFLNLAGRAGRLGVEFHGNVWCLHPMKWETQCYLGEPLQEIRSSFDRVLEDGGTAIRKVFEDEE
jgi:replicative superfamily II helicase